MKPARIVALVLGCLLLLPGLAVLAAGAVLLTAHVTGRDRDGYFDVALDRLETDTVAITAEEIDLMAEPGSPDELLDALDADVRLRVTSAASDGDIFVGIGPETEVDAYLAGFAHDEIVEVGDGTQPVYRSRTGDLDIDPPTEQPFWTESAAGPGTQELTWEAESGRWAVAVMNADGSPAVAADVNVGARVDVVLPLALLLLGVGTIGVAAGVLLIVVAAAGGRMSGREHEPAASVPVGGPELGGPELAGAATGTSEPAAQVTPVVLTASLDPALSRWRWLVKWFLAIPHFLVLVFLWIGFVVLTVLAGFSILFTGTYPRRFFDFNVGVLRWTWRVAYYATTGGIGTDRYPPFTLEDDLTYPARLDVAYPERLSRGLVLVKWWLLAIPHYLIIGLLTGSAQWSTADDGGGARAGISLLGLLVLIAGVGLLFTGRYPARLFDLIVGINRWIYRVIAYAALMTDRYPPFRLDQGGADPSGTPPAGGPGGAPAPEVARRPQPVAAEPPPDEARAIAAVPPRPAPVPL